MENKDNPRITDYLYRKASMNNIPIELAFELTPVCNMNCKMCYVRKSKKEQENEGKLLSAQEWRRIAEDAAELGTLYILLTGGEVFTRSDLPQILKDLNELGMVVGINTNGTLINENTIGWLAENRPNRVNITVYGASNDSYSRLCNNPFGFSQMKEAVRLLKSKNIDVRLKSSITPDNVHEMYQIIDYAKSENLPLELTIYMFPPLRKTESSIGLNKGRLDADTAAEKLNSAMIHQYGLDAAKRNWASALQAAEEDSESTGTSNIGDPIRCRAGKTNFWITWKGDVLGCGMIPDRHGNLLNKSLSEVIENVRSKTSEIRLPVKCANCNIRKICKPCAAVVYTETGSYTKVPEYQCQYAHKIVSDMRATLKYKMENTNEK